MRSILAFLLVVAIAGCATPYQPEGMSGGFSETQLDTNVFKVSFRGNGVTKPGAAEDMALLRSAELALKNGFTHFVIVDGNSRSDYSTISTPTQARTTGTMSSYGNTSYLNTKTTVSGGDTFVVAKPSTTNLIVCFTGRPETSRMVYDARFIFDSLGKRYGAANLTK